MIIAKTDPLESLNEHTNELLIRYEQLKKFYNDSINNSKVWELLYLAVVYHDAGKAYTEFQERMKRFLGKEVDRSNLPSIPHNYLSPFFLPIEHLKLNKFDRRVLIEAIAYHHEREQLPDEQQLLEIAEKYLVNKLNKVGKELGVTVADSNKYFRRIVKDITKRRTKYNSDDENYLNYVLVKGLLHRLDHAASAHVPIEIDYDYDLSELTKKYLKKLTNNKGNFLRPLQQFALENQDKNLILTAQTGMGKTEAALIWAGKKKTFFTVPLRVSLNALYDRVANEMNYKNCGLLHSSSAHHLSNSGEENWEVIYDQSKHFSNKLTFTTIDQILKFPFKFKGYEKYYATLAYSCVIIDEIQGYDPWIVAVMIKALEMIYQLGGKFMIMTATLPTIYVDALRDKKIIDENCIVKTFSDDKVIRHRYKLEESSILNNLDMIAESAQDKKVLAIVNTVDQANELYENLKDRVENIYVFHARFIQRDRQLLEARLKEFDRNREEKGLWITTQIVEASIDIDFDELHTELAPLDSLFQRFGRCYRKRKLDKESENIVIYTKEVSGSGTVYDKDILRLSEQLLYEHSNGKAKVILESMKIKMVEELYSEEKLNGTKFYEKFKDALKVLETLDDHIYTHDEAQKELRGDNSVMVIPRTVYDEIIPLFEELEEEQEKSKRTEIRRKIELHTCSVSKYTYRKYLQPIDHFRRTLKGKYRLMDYVYILDREYDFDSQTLRGLGIKKEADNPLNQFW